MVTLASGLGEYKARFAAVDSAVSRSQGVSPMSFGRQFLLRFQAVSLFLHFFLMQWVGGPLQNCYTTWNKNEKK